MSKHFGTLYTHKLNPRTLPILAVAKANGLQLDIIYADQHENKEGYEKLLTINPLGKVPTFVGADGYVLTECIVILLYVTQQNDTTRLLGACRRDYLEVLKWMSFANTDFLPSVGGYLLPLIGRRQKLRSDSFDCLNAMHQYCKLTDDHLAENQFLIGDQLTLADFFLSSVLAFAFMAFRKVVSPEYPSLTRWFHEISNIPSYKDAAGEFPQLDLPFPHPATEEDTVTQGKGVEMRQETVVGA